MKRMMLFMMLMLGVVSAVMAQGTDVPATDYDAMIGTFAGFVGGVVVLTEGLKGLFPNMKGWVTQLVSWCVGLVCVMLLWWLDAGFVSDVSWDIALPLWFWCLTCGQWGSRHGTGAMGYRTIPKETRGSRIKG